MDKGCEIKIISERDVDVISQGVELKKGTFWAKFDKQKEAPVRIKTAGGVMGIRGTEFVVQVQEDGSTKLSLLEGDVLVRAKNGESFEAKPGHEVTFGADTPLLAKLYELEELNSRLRAELGPAFVEMRDALREFRESWRENKVAVRTGVLQAQTGLLMARQAALVGDDATRRQFERGGEAREGLDTARDSLKDLDKLLEGLDAKGDPSDSQPRNGPNPEVVAGGPGGIVEQTTPLAVGEHPTVAWNLKEGEQYAVLFLDPVDDEAIYWVGETTASTYTHPDDAKPLEPGEYRYRVIPLDREGEVVGKALEGRFRVSG